MTVGVCGFPRCGSTMVMKMLDAGGVAPVAGTSLVSYELDHLDSFLQLPVDALRGRSVKLLDFALWQGVGTWPVTDWSFIWIRRARGEQARSQQKFHRWALPHLRPVPSTSSLKRSYDRDEPVALSHLRRLGDVCVLAFEEILTGPSTAARDLKAFLGAEHPNFDAHAAAAVVIDRDPACAPDMAFEEALSL